MSAPVRVTYVGGPTAMLEVGGVRLLLDPTFDPPGEYSSASGTLTKTVGPAVPVADIGRVDAVLLSHDQHRDNLDVAGRQLLSSVPLVLSTGAAADRIPGVRAVPNWSDVQLRALRIT